MMTIPIRMLIIVIRLIRIITLMRILITNTINS